MWALWVFLPIISLITLILACVITNKIGYMQRRIDEIANNIKMRENQNLSEKK